MYNSKTLILTETEFASNEKRLSICLRTNGFSFSEISLSGTLLTYGEAVGTHADTMTGVIGDVKDFFNSVGIRPFGYKDMQLMLLSDENVWVPDELYSPSYNQQYLSLVGADAESLMTAHCSALGSTAVFAASDKQALAFKVALPGLNVVNQHVRMASLGLEKCSMDHPVLLINWREGKVDFAAFSEGKYIFGNTISQRSDNEVLYHTIEVLKSYQLADKGTELLLCGEVDRQRFSLLRPYFPVASLFTGCHSSFINPQFRTLHTYRNALIM